MTEGTPRCERRFSAVPPDCPRYTWDPAVHDHFEENCWFYILRASDAEWTIKLHSALEAKLAEADVPGVTSYGLYGYYDALIRVWATEGIRRRVMRTFRSLAAVIEDIGEFRADHVTSTFATDHPNKETIYSLIPQIDQVQDAEAQAKYSASANESFDKLLANSIIHEVPPDSGVKFLMPLRRVADRQSLQADQEAQKLLASCQRSEIQAVSVYSGIGSFVHLIEGIKPSFEDLLPALLGVHETAQSVGLRTMTFPVANFPFLNESDVLSSRPSHQIPVSTGLAQEALQALRLQDDQVVLQGLTPQQLTAFLSLYTRFKAEFGTTGQWKRMSGILRASLLGEREELGDLLSFLTYIESDLRALLPRLLAREIGSRWYDALTSETSLTGNVVEWTLRQYMDALRWANERSSDGVGAFLEPHLGESWTSGLRKVQDLRNEYAHGRLLTYPTFTTFDSDWGRVLDRVFEAAKVSKGLHSAVQELSKGKE